MLTTTTAPGTATTDARSDTSAGDGSTGAAEYEATGLPFPLRDTPSPDTEFVVRVRGQFRARGLRVQ